MKKLLLTSTLLIAIAINLFEAKAQPSCYANFIYSVDTATNTAFFTDSSYSPGIITNWNWDFGVVMGLQTLFKTPLIPMLFPVHITYV